MYETEYLKLKVAEENDFYNINEHAENMEKIDKKMKEAKEMEEGLKELIQAENERAESAEAKNSKDIEEVSSTLTSEINNKISDLIGGAPETLDTLKEIADAIAENKEIVDALNEAIGKKVNVEDFDTEILNLGKSVAEGKQLLAATLSGWGPSPVASDAAFEVLNSAINNTVGTYGDNRYNQGYVKGVQDADGRALPGTVNYQSGYNQGVADADGRANSNSANWQNGYATGVAQADARVAPGTANYQGGYDAGAATEGAACLNAIKNNAQHHYYDITVSYKKSDNNGLYSAKNGSGYPTATGYSSITGEKEFGVGGGYRIWIVMHLWSGIRNNNGWTDAFSRHI